MIVVDFALFASTAHIKGNSVVAQSLPQGYWRRQSIGHRRQDTRRLAPQRRV